MRKYIQVLCLVIVFGLSSEYSQAATFTSTASGLWNNVSIWVITNGVDADGIPDDDDDVIISNSHSVYVNVASTVRSVTVGTSDELYTAYLYIANGVELNIAENCYIYSGGYSGPDFENGIFEPTTAYKRLSVGTSSGAGNNTKLIIGGNLIIAASDVLDIDNIYTGVQLMGSSQLLLAGNISLPHNRGGLTAAATATVTLNGSSSQQIYMAHGTGIKYPNLIVDGNYVTIIGSPGGEIGFVSGDLIVKKGVFNNSGRQIKVSRDIVVENEASFHLSGGSTISVETGTNLVLDGKLVTEHVDGLGGFKPLGTINFGPDSEIEYYGNTAGQFAGFQWFPTISSCPKLSFSNTLGTAMDKSVTVEDLTINANGILNGNGSSPEITVTNNWTNNGIFNGQTSTVRLAGNAGALLGTGANNFHHLIIDSGVDFSAPQTLTVSGSLTVNVGGSFNHNNGRVVFKPTGGAQQTSGVGQFWDVTVDGSGVVFNGQDTINHELYLRSGTSSIQSSASLALNLNSGYINPDGNGGLVGNVHFFKSASTKGYTGLSFPIATTVSNLNSGGFQNIYKYDDQATPYQLVKQAAATVLDADAKAYACHASFNNSENPTIRLTGNYNNTRNEVVVPVVSNPRNGTFVSGVTGWNMIGNPFAFDVDWDELIVNPANSSVYSGIYFQKSNGMESYVGGVPAGSNRIAPMQGFMVYLFNPGNTSYTANFTFDKASGLQSTNILKRKAPITNVLKLNVTDGTNSDVTYVRLTDDATVDFDPQLDAYKFRNSGNVPSFFSYLNGTNYSINSVPESFSRYTLPLAFEPKVAGSYSITLSEEYTYDLPYEIYLEDKFLNVLHPIASEPYTFNTNLNEGAARFALHFENSVITAMEGASSKLVRVHTEGRDITVHGLQIEEPAEICLYDIAGRLIARHNGVDLRNKSFDLKSGNSAGIYIVTIISGEKAHSERVVVY